MKPSQPTNQQPQAAEYELYKRIKLLGEGAFGKAYLVEDLRTHELLVQKQMDMKAMSSEEKRETQKEAKILQQLNHPNIVKFKDVYNTKKGKLCIIMEYADGGDLAKVVKDAKGKFLQEKQILDWFTQICLAMKHVHDRKIIHRDLKGQNIFLTRNQIVKLGDFGIARVLSKTVEKAKTMVGTPYYLSPEIIESKPYSFKTDIWSLGVILYELCALKPPFNADSLHFLALKIIKGQYTPIPNHFSKEMKNLIASLLQVDSVRRPSINDIIKMPIINERVKSFLSETIRLVEFSHTVLHNKKIDAKVNMADIKMVNNETPMPAHLLQQMMKQDQNNKEQAANQQQNQQNKPNAPIPPTQQQQPQQQQQQQQKAANYHYQNKPSLAPQNPVLNYANNYRPPSARNEQRPNIVGSQQQQAQDQERKRELERQRIEKERQQQLDAEKYKEMERQRAEKEKQAMIQLAMEKENRMKRQREKELKEMQEREREKELKNIAIERQRQQMQQQQQIPQRREEQGAGGLGVYGNPNFKPKPSVPTKNISLANKAPLPSQQQQHPKSGGQDKRPSSKPAVARSGSNQPGQQLANKKLADKKKEEEQVKQRMVEMKLLRQKSEQEKKEFEQKKQKEKDEENQKKKEEKQKMINDQREQIKKDRSKWQRGGDMKIEFISNNVGGSGPNSINQLEKESDSDITNPSTDRLENNQKKEIVKPKKWDMGKNNNNNKKDDWNIEIYESKRKEVPQSNKNKQKSEEILDEYNSDSEQKEVKIEKPKYKTDQDLDEYNSDSDDFNDRKQDITAQEVPEIIDEEVSRLEQVREETYLMNMQKNSGDGDDTTFNVNFDIDINDPSELQNIQKELQNLVQEAQQNVGRIDDKYARNDIFDFTATQKTKKFNLPIKSEQKNDILSTEDDDMKERDDDSDEPDPASQTGRFLDDFPEPPQLKPKVLAKDEEESINVISSGYEALEQYYMKLEEELQDKFQLAYNIMSDELKKINYNLDKLEQMYSNNGYKDVLKFLSEEQINKYLRLIITLVCMEQELSKNNHSC